MLHGPQEYAKLSSEALKFINSKPMAPKPVIKKPYEYLAPGANLEPIMPAEESAIHTYKSPFDVNKNINEENAANLDIII